MEEELINDYSFEDAPTDEINNREEDSKSYFVSHVSDDLNENPRGKTGIVMCHGFTSSVQSIYKIVNILDKFGYTISAPLLKGHGKSSIDLQNITVDDWIIQVKDEVTKLKDLGCDRIILGGISFGGLIATHIADELRKNDTKIIEKLFIINAPFTYPNIFMGIAPILSKILPKMSFTGVDKYAGIRGNGHYDVTLPRIYINALIQFKKMISLAKKSAKNIGSLINTSNELPVALFYSSYDHIIRRSSFLFAVKHFKKIFLQILYLDDHVPYRSRSTILHKLDKFIQDDNKIKRVELTPSDVLKEIKERFPRNPIFVETLSNSIYYQDKVRSIKEDGSEADKLNFGRRLRHYCYMISYYLGIIDALHKSKSIIEDELYQSVSILERLARLRPLFLLGEPSNGEGGIKEFRRYDKPHTFFHTRKYVGSNKYHVYGLKSLKGLHLYLHIFDRILSKCGRSYEDKMFTQNGNLTKEENINDILKKEENRNKSKNEIFDDHNIKEVSIKDIFKRLMNAITADDDIQVKHELTKLNALLTFFGMEYDPNKIIDYKEILDEKKFIPDNKKWILGSDNIVMIEPESSTLKSLIFYIILMAVLGSIITPFITNGVLVGCLSLCLPMATVLNTKIEGGSRLKDLIIIFGHGVLGSALAYSIVFHGSLSILIAVGSVNLVSPIGVIILAFAIGSMIGYGVTKFSNFELLIKRVKGYILRNDLIFKFHIYVDKGLGICKSLKKKSFNFIKVNFMNQKSEESKLSLDQLFQSKIKSLSYSYTNGFSDVASNVKDFERSESQICDRNELVVTGEPTESSDETSSSEFKENNNDSDIKKFASNDKGKSNSRQNSLNGVENKDKEKRSTFISEKPARGARWSS